MNFPRNNFSQNWYDAGNFGIYQPQNLNCSPAYFMANDSVNFTETLRDGLGSFAERLSCYGMKAKDAIASVYCTANDKKENIIDGFEELVSRFNYRSVQSGNDWCIKDNIIDRFENIVDKSKRLSLLVNSRLNITNLKEQAIDNFEELVEKSKLFSLQTTNKLRKVRSVKEKLKDHAVDNFEELVEKSRDIGMKAKRHVWKVNSFKENLGDEAVDNFEDFVDKSKNLGLKTTLNLKKVESFREKVIDEFELLLQKLNTNRGSVDQNLKCLVEEKKNDIIEGFEEIIDQIKDNTNNKVEKVECLKDQVIDDFEDLVERLKTNIIDLENNVKCFTDEKGEDIIEECEEIICKMRNFGKSILERTNDQVMRVNCVREDIVDSFENLLTRLNDFGIRTDNEVRQKLCCIKEEIVDDFEDLVQRFNTNLKCVEDNLRGYTCGNKDFIVDQFEEIIDDLKEQINCIDLNIRGKVNQFFCDLPCIVEDTKYMMECKTNQILANAECVLEDIVCQVEEALECGKCDVEVELNSIKYWLCMGEMLAKEFLCFSERMVEDFCRFSEKRVACFLCDGKQKAKVFYNEVVDSLVRGFEDKLLNDNLVLEINSSRYAYNVTMSEVNFHVVRALLTLPGPDGRSWQHVVSRLSYFMPILTNYIRSDAAQKDCLLAIEDVAGSHPEIFAFLVKIIHWLYEHDILSEDIILDWYNHPCADSDPENSRSVRQQVAPFIRWLQEAEEDDEDD